MTRRLKEVVYLAESVMSLIAILYCRQGIVRKRPEVARQPSFFSADALEVSGQYKTYTVVVSEDRHVTRGFSSHCGSPIISYTEEEPGTRFNYGNA